MKISVCFKILPDYDQVRLEEWKTGLLLPDFRFVKKNFGVFDEGALETALCLKDVLNSIYLEAVCFGHEDSIFTEALYAAGYDSVVYLSNAGSSFDVSNTARVLSSYLGKSCPDIILCGEQAGPADSGLVPYIIADTLKLPLIDKVSSLIYEDSSIVICRDTEDRLEKYRYGDRCVAVVSNAAKPYLRWAAFSRKKAAETMKPVKKAVFTRPSVCSAVMLRKKRAKRNTVFFSSAADLDRLIREVTP